MGSYRTIYYWCHSQHQKEPYLFLDMGFHKCGVVCGGFLSRPLQPSVLIPDIFRACGVRDMALENESKLRRKQ